ncbi:BREX-1 system adenine-specific DNA-methyltransferase PglX [Jatrophihabitans sp. DSM 45814]
METAPLKTFATRARIALIREVTARIAVVLAPASAVRVEQPTAVAALEKAVSAAGGGEKGIAAVADRVAYTWFNRIIALRFMDANGYNGIGVVSPQVGVEAGQPEILAEAKRGNIDAAVVGGRTRETVTGLLDGTRRSDDAQGEAYALLLADYCRYWNRAMPFMFEREGDFTELLIPANLLADDSVPSRALKVLTKDVCQDVEVIGWLYQFYISERHDQVFAGFKKNKKAGADEIPAATQLFTPHWIVRYLVENSLGRLWMLNRPSSRLVDHMQYYIAPVDEETDYLKITSPKEVKVIDPACGSGHMLTYAFELLYAIYEEEGYAPTEIPGLILGNNLYGVEIDPRAGALSAFALTMKARAKQRTFFNKQIEPNVCVLDAIHFTPDEIDFLLTPRGDKHAEASFWNQFEHAETFGSLIQPDRGLTIRLKQHLATLDDGGDILLADVFHRAEKVTAQAEALSVRYHVVVANPPYMGVKNMTPSLAGFIESNIPDGKQDLYGAFVERARSLAMESGRIAMITGDTWMFIRTFSDLRDVVLDATRVHSLLYLRDSAYHADKFGANSAFSLTNAKANTGVGTFIRLTALDGEEKRQSLLAAIADRSLGYRYEAAAAAFKKIPGAPIAYWLSDAITKAFQGSGTFRDGFTPRKGNDTGDNGRFLRQVWEVSRSTISFGSRSTEEAERSGRRWFPYNKGGPFRKWYGNFDLVVDWEDNGRRVRARGTLRNQGFYFHEGITWTDVGSGSFGARYLPPGFLCDNSGSACYGDKAVLPSALAFLCSSLGSEMLNVLNPTMHFQAGNIADLPLRRIESETIDVIVRRGIATFRADWDSYETSWDFEASPLLDGRSANLADVVQAFSAESSVVAKDQQARETENNSIVAKAYGVDGDVPIDVPLHRVSLTRNVEFRYGPGRSAEEYSALERTDLAIELLSYAVGCMFGRYSIDEPGLILADQGATLREYLLKVPTPSFLPDADNVIPIVDGDWFEDDIVARFRTFLRAAFGERHFEENLRFVTESLGVKDIRDYFVRSFYKDHVQRYKKRPIYWLFSSPKGSFNALIYLHRYTPSTVSTVLNEYLREFTVKLTSSLQQQERLAAEGGTPRQQAAAQKEADRLRKVLLELEEYEHDVLYPLASRQLAIDLDDGVKANYPKFGPALKKISGLEASDE